MSDDEARNIAFAQPSSRLRRHRRLDGADDVVLRVGALRLEAAMSGFSAVTSPYTRRRIDLGDRYEDVHVMHRALLFRVPFAHAGQAATRAGPRRYMQRNFDESPA